MIDRNKFLKDLQDLLKQEYRLISQNNSGILIDTSRSIVKDIANHLKSYDTCMLTAISVTEYKEYFELLYCYSLDLLLESFNIMFRCTVDKKVNALESISEIFISAMAFEERIQNIYNIRFVKIVPETMPLLNCTPFPVSLKGFEVNPMMVGIFDPIHLNNNYFEFEIKEGTIENIVLKDGWLFKNFNKILNKSSYQEALQLVEKIDPLTTVHFKLGLCMAFEDLLKISLSNKVQYIRMFLAELERIHNHIIWFANLFNLMDFATSFMNLLLIRNKYIEFLHKICDNDFLENTITLGSSIDISQESADHLLISFKELIKELFAEIYSVLYSNFTKEKLKNSGIISRNEALANSLTGPSIRGCGIPYDIRYNTPYLSYIKGELSQLWEIVTFTADTKLAGDNFSRAEVRLWEIKQSHIIIDYILKNISVYGEKVTPYELPKGKFELPKNGFAVTRLEAPQGLLTTIVSTDKNIKTDEIGHIYIIPPALNNYYALQGKLLKNKPVGEAPLTIHSMDLSFSALDM